MPSSELLPLPRTMFRVTISHTIRHLVSSESLLKRLHIEPLDTYYHRRIIRWAGHVSRMPMSRAPRKLLTSWVANSRPIGCPQMTWGRTLKKALLCNGLSSEFTKWRDLAANRDEWRVICGSTSRRATNKAQPNNSRQAIWTELRSGAQQRFLP